MSNRRCTAALAAAVAAAALSGLLGIAGRADAATPQTAATTGSLTLTVRGADTQSSVTLRCAPTGGSHPHSRQACTAVTQAKGDLTALKPQEGMMCATIYAPVTAAARGTWHGKPVRYKHTFGNACTLHVATGAVFDF